jgi:hypothetical protein
MMTNRFAWMMLAGVMLLGGGRAWAQPWNDDFNKATEIIQSAFDPDSTITVAGTSVNAAKQTNERNHAGNAGGASVWYKWTPLASTVGLQVSIDTFGSTFDTLLAVYANPVSLPVAATPVVAENDDANTATQALQSRVTFVVAAATTYYIAVDGYKGSQAGSLPKTGSVQLNIGIENTRPANDSFADRINLFGSQITTIAASPPIGFDFGEATGGSATFETGELWNQGQIPSDQYDYFNKTDPEDTLTGEQVNGNQLVGTIWFSWTAPYNGTCAIGVSEQTPGFYNVWQGSHLLSMDQLTDSRQLAGLPQLPTAAFDVVSTFQVQEGVTYQIQLVYTRPRPDLVGASGADTGPGDGEYYSGPGDPYTGVVVLSLSMYNEPPQIQITNPQHNQILSRQTIPINAYVVETDGNQTLDSPILTDERFLPFVDRVKFFARPYTGLVNPPTGGLGVPSGSEPIFLGVDEEPTGGIYTVDWVPIPGDWELWAVAEDDEFGYDPLTGDVVVTSRQGSNTLAPVNVRILDVSATTGLPNNPLTNNTTLVNEIYNDILGRPPTDAERDAALAGLGNGTQTAGGLANDLLQASAFESFGEPLIRLFRSFLLRLPTPAEFDVYLGLMTSGNQTLLQVAHTLNATSEFAAIYPASLSNSQFVTLAFQNTLGRSPAGSELSAWSTSLTAGTQTRLTALLSLTENAYYGGTPLYDLGDFEETAIAYLLVYNVQPTFAQVNGAPDPAALVDDYYTSAEYVERYFPDAQSYSAGGNTVFVDEVGGVLVSLDAGGNITFQELLEYATWADDEETALGLGPAALTNPNGDFEADGVENIIEAAFRSLGMVANVSDAGLQPASSIVGGNVILDYPLDLAFTDILITPEVSANGGGTWFDIADPLAPVTVTQTTLGISGSVATQRLSTPVAPNVLLRLNIDFESAGGK